MKTIVFLIVLSMAFGCSKKLLTGDYSSLEKQKKAEAAAPQKAEPDEAMPIEAPASPPPVFQNIYFDFDKSDLSKDATVILEKIGDYLRENKDTLEISGHCDERGSDEYNDSLGMRRAMAAKNFILFSSGVNPKLIKAKSLGKSEPVNKNCNDDSCHAENRRDVFMVK